MSTEAHAALDAAMDNDMPRLRARVRGSIALQLCVDCGGQAHHWTYNHQDQNELHGPNKRGQMVPYSLDPSFYDPRCRTCHRRFDLAVSRGA